MNYVRRFVFVHYEDLLDIRFKKLEKVTDKLYVFTPDDVAAVPLSLVRQVQAMGSDLEWVGLGGASRAVATSILAFRVGALHEKVDLGVEFALLSDDEDLDALVSHIQATGRSCIRVKQRAPGSSGDGDTPSGKTAHAPLDARRANAEAPASLGSLRPSKSRGGSPADADGDRDQATGRAFDAGLREDGQFDLKELLGDARGDGAADYDDDLVDLDSEVELERGAGSERGSGTERGAAAPPSGFNDYRAFGSEQRRGRGANGAMGVPAAGAPGGGAHERAPLRQHLRSNGAAALREEGASAAQCERDEVTALADDLVRRLIRSGNRPADLSMLRSYILLHAEEASAVRHVDAIIAHMADKGEIKVGEGDDVTYAF